MKLVSIQFKFLKISRAKLFITKNNLFKDELRCNCPINSRLAIDGHDGTSFGELMLPFDDHPIADEGSRCDFIT